MFIDGVVRTNHLGRIYFLTIVVLLLLLLLLLLCCQDLWSKNQNAIRIKTAMLMSEVALAALVGRCFYFYLYVLAIVSLCHCFSCNFLIVLFSSFFNICLAFFEGLNGINRGGGPFDG